MFDSSEELVLESSEFSHFDSHVAHFTQSKVFLLLEFRPDRNRSLLSEVQGVHLESETVVLEVAGTLSGAVVEVREKARAILFIEVAT